MDDIYKDIELYYSDKLIQYGVTPKGVDWNDDASQKLRFSKLLSIIDNKQFTIADLGCGYGKLVDCLQDEYKHFSYYGYDLSLEMIKAAKNIYNRENIYFSHIDKPELMLEADYTVASGIFNVKMNTKNEEWFEYILSTLRVMNDKSKKGFSFNFLTSYSDKELMRKDLYYADPLWFFDFCKRNFSKNVSLLHDYDLYEFTILVRKGG